MEKEAIRMVEKRYQTVIQVYRAILLLLGATTIVSGAVSWIMTGNASTVLISSFVAISLAFGFYNRYQINIFKRKIIVAYNAIHEKEMIYSIALGLYSAVIVALLFVSAFILRNIFALSTVTTTGTILVEITVFSAIGYRGMGQLRKNIEWMQQPKI